MPRPKGPTFTYDELLDRMNKEGNPRRPVQPAEVAAYVVEGIEADRFWILPDGRHDDMRDQFDAIIRARAESMVGRTDPVSYMQKAT